MAGNNLLKIFPGGFKADDFLPLDDQIKESALSVGIKLPSYLIKDGNIQKFKLDANDKKISGFYALHDHGDFLAGIVGKFKNGEIIHNVRAFGRPMSPMDMQKIEDQIKAARENAEKDKTRRHDEGARNAQRIWEDCGPAPINHRYIERKGLADTYGAKVARDGCLLIPAYNSAGELRSLQRIAPEKPATGTDKKNLYKSSNAGCFWVIGTPELSERIFIAEGFATAATIFEETGEACYVGFSSNNLPKIAGAIRAINGNKKIIVAADSGNDGEKYGRKAAEIAGADLKVCPLPDGADYNDYKTNGGDVKAVLIDSNPWLTKGADLIKSPMPIKWHIKKWLQKDALIMIHGPSGHGKTFAILDMALTLSSGLTDWHGVIARPTPVVYLAGEGHLGIAKRIKGWCLSKDIDDPGNIWVSSSGTNLNRPEGLQKVMTEITALPVNPGLVIIDTLHRFLEGDENSPIDTKTMIDACAALKEEFGCSAILVHHTGLSEAAQERGRGSSSWQGALDNEINIQKNNDTLRLARKKFKESEGNDENYFSIEKIDVTGWLDEDGEQETTLVVTGKTSKPAGKSSAKEKEDIGLLKAAWDYSGKEAIEGNPKITESAFKEFFRKELDKSEDVIRKDFNLNIPRTSTIKRLITGGKIIKELNYFRVISQELAAQMMISRQADK